MRRFSFVLRNFDLFQIYISDSVTSDGSSDRRRGIYEIERILRLSDVPEKMHERE